jgi:type II secretory pathway component PulC
VSRAVAKSKTVIKEKTTAVKEKVTSSMAVKEVTKAVKEPVKTVTKALSSKTEQVPVQAESEKGQWGTDPFVRDWVLGFEVKDLKLSAITQSGTKAYALINDQILEAGEVIAGKRIVSIDQDKVILEQGGRTFTLLLGQ